MKNLFIILLLLFSLNIYSQTINKYNYVSKSDSISSKSDSIRIKLIDSINNQLNVRETSYNRGKMIDIYNKEVGASLGSSWCASFVGSNLKWAGVPSPPNPHSAWSPNYGKNNIIWKTKRINNIQLKSGDVVTFYYSNLGRIGHTGFYIETDKDGYFITIEGNTNGDGSREGDGVYKKKRSPNKIYTINRYIK